MVPAEIKTASFSDYQAIYSIYEPYVLHTVASFETEAPGIEQFKARIEGSIDTFPWLVAVVNGTVAGYAYAGKHRIRSGYRWAVETSIYVDSNWHRHGIATGLYTSLLLILRLLGYRSALAGITLPNEPSVRFHESMGFIPVGIYRNIGYKAGSWHDVGWWQANLNDYEESPTPPGMFRDSLNTDLLQAALECGTKKLRT